MVKIRGVVQGTPNLLKVLRFTTIAVCGFYLALMLLGLPVYVLLDPNTSSIELIKMLFELALWLSIPILGLMIVARAWRLSILGAVLVIIFLVIYAPLFFTQSVEVDPGARQLSVMSFNLQGSSTEVAEIIREANADIVALQELSQSGADALQPLEDLYPYRALHPQADPNIGQGILSKYPIEANEYWEYAQLPQTLGHQRVEIQYADDLMIVVYNIHPWPPLAWSTGYNDESHRLALLDIIDRTDAETLPLILAGDFNMTDVFEEYEMLARRFTDSYRAAGVGPGYTFPNKGIIPFSLLRLDYIWHSDQFTSIDAQVWPRHGESDHSPVVSSLAIFRQDATP